MCRRLTQSPSPGRTLRPGDLFTAIRQGREGLLETVMYWGFPMGRRMLPNARAETAHEKPSFARAFAGRRCAVPATSFTEYSAKGAPTVFVPEPAGEEDAEMLLAALWQPLDRECACAVIITQRATGPVASVHHRMPAIIRRADLDEWLDPETPQERLLALLQPGERRALTPAA